MKPKQPLYRHRFTHFTDALIPVYNRLFEVLAGRYVSAEFGLRANNALRRHLAKGEYTLYPSHLTEAGLVITHEELGVFA
jgi:hypothetical protein